jgi:hypothetical protein
LSDAIDEALDTLSRNRYARRVIGGEGLAQVGECGEETVDADGCDIASCDRRAACG